MHPARKLACLGATVFALGAKPPDPRVDQLRSWKTSGYVLDITQADDTAIVDVGLKWIRLPLDRQTKMAATIAGLVHDGQELDQVTIEKPVKDDEPVLLGRSTYVDAQPFVSWESWYALEVTRREFARSK